MQKKLSEGNASEDWTMHALQSDLVKYASSSSHHKVSAHCMACVQYHTRKKKQLKNRAVTIRLSAQQNSSKNSSNNRHAQKLYAHANIHEKGKKIYLCAKSRTQKW